MTSSVPLLLSEDEQSDSSEDSMGSNKSLDRNEKDLEIFTRPNSSPGFWLCILLPICYLMNIYRYSDESSISSLEYKLTTVISIGFSLQSIFFFVHLNLKSNFIVNILFMFTPSIITSTLVYFFVKHGNVFFSIAFTITILFMYQYFYVKILKILPKSFTLGEGSIVLQGLHLFVMNAIIKIPNWIKHSPVEKLTEMQAIMMTALFTLLILCIAFYTVELFRNTIAFYILMIGYCLFVCLIPVTKDLPIVTIWNFIVNDLKRIIIIAFYFGLVGITGVTVIWRLHKSEKATTSIRKIFHIIIVVVFIPGILYECTLLYIATGVALAFLIIFEILRLLKIPPFYESLSQMVELFSDEKDSGIVILTPIYLHIGCSLPLWINPNVCQYEKNQVDLIILLSGILSIGIGDTAASVIGSKYGRLKWTDSTKSIEGTIANIICQFVVIIAIYCIGYFNMTYSVIIFISSAVIITSLVEAFTDQVDNLVLPLIFYSISSLS